MFNPLSGASPDLPRVSQPGKVAAPTSSSSPPLPSEPIAPAGQKAVPKATTPNLPDASTVKQDVAAIGSLDIQLEKVGKAAPVLKSLFRGIDDWGPVQGNRITLPDKASPGLEPTVIGSIPGEGQQDPLLAMIRAFQSTFKSGS